MKRLAWAALLGGAALWWWSGRLTQDAERAFHARQRSGEDGVLFV